MQVDANLALVGFDAERDFDAIVSADLFERLKPAPDIFLAAAEQVIPNESLTCDLRSWSFGPETRVHIVPGWMSACHLFRVATDASMFRRTILIP